MAILAIHSLVAYGHVGHRAAVLTLERLGHEVWAVPTVLFSNHPAHGDWRGRVLPAAEVADLVGGIAARGVLERCQAVLSGYLGDPGTGAVVLDAVTRVRTANPAALYCCDPVIGEVGRGVYVRPGIPEIMADRLLPAADLVTPNPFELAHLSRCPPAGLASLDGAREAAEALRRRGPALVVATGLALREYPGQLGVLAVAATGTWLARAPRRAVPAHGAGDLFTALFLGVYLRSRDVSAALTHAVAAMDAVLARTEALGAAELALVEAQDALVHPPGRVPVARLA